MSSELIENENPTYWEFQKMKTQAKKARRVAWKLAVQVLKDQKRLELTIKQMNTQLESVELHNQRINRIQKQFDQRKRVFSKKTSPIQISNEIKFTVYDDPLCIAFEQFLITNLNRIKDLQIPRRSKRKQAIWEFCQFQGLSHKRTCKNSELQRALIRVYCSMYSRHLNQVRAIQTSEVDVN